VIEPRTTLDLQMNPRSSYGTEDGTNLESGCAEAFGLASDEPAAQKERQFAACACPAPVSTRRPDRGVSRSVAGIPPEALPRRLVNEADVEGVVDQRGQRHAKLGGDRSQSFACGLVERC
jgi:hypothetical protein